jgi:putative nucleotidyltransferase with HDIG domain
MHVAAKLPEATTQSGPTACQALIVDEASSAEQAAFILGREGFSVRVASSAMEALRLLRETGADVLLTAFNAPEIDGLRLLAQIRERYPDTEVVIMADSNDIESALEAMRQGAAEFLLKPFEPQDLKRVALACMSSARLSQDKMSLAQSSSMLTLWKLLASGADTHAVPVYAAELARKNFEADSATLLSFAAAHRQLSVLSHAGVPLSQAGQTRHLIAHAQPALEKERASVATDADSGDCYAFAPLKVADRRLGVLALRRAGGPWFHERSLELLELFATHLAVLLDALRLHDVAVRQVSELEEMVTTSRSLSNCVEDDLLYQRVLTSAARVTGAELCALLIIEEGAPQVRTLPVLAPETELFEAVRSRLLAVWQPEDTAPARATPPEARRSLRSFAHAPMALQGCRFGVLGVFSPRPEAFSLEDTARLSAIAESAARARENNWRMLRITFLYNETVELLGQSIDARCPNSAGHSSQVRAYAAELARAVGIQGQDLRQIEDGALLHDIGKVRVPEAVLHKPGELTAQEFAMVAAHPVHGAEMLMAATHLRCLIPLVRHHHERYDGAGYPDRLRGEAIPVGARIIALGDAFDALISHRAHRRALSGAEARRHIAGLAGKQFDPALAGAFLKMPLEELIER